ncbi:cytosolic 5'-nucleotidase 1B isoform X4 [Lemur catta]|uniref:cytosolic 5'-nucleotidase 1B isoform X4 n=1 Tax=Lemur catta TaxID=9447 RepID=UPI001E268303|nr:cytosolic 5'-nucleotidase 1B isoform X4 [Lemur catta]
MSQTSVKQKKKNETGVRNSKESLDGEQRKDSDKPGVRLNTQGHSSCRHCLCAALGTVLGPCRTLHIYIHMCLLWEQGQQITMIRGSQELLTKTDSRGYLVRNQWSRTSRTPSIKAASEEPRSKNNSVKLPNSSTTSRTSSTSPSQHDSPPPTPARQSKPNQQSLPFDSRPPTPPEPEPSTRRPSTKTKETPESRTQSIMRTSQQRDYTLTAPTEWKSYSQRRMFYPSAPQLEADCMSQQQQEAETEEEKDDEEAYWESLKKFYEKVPSCSRPRPPKPKHAVTIAVSSRALFNMVDARKVYEEEGLEKYMEYQLNNENVILTPGPAFRFVKALQHVNSRLRELYPNEQDLFDIVLMTNNHAQVGVRLINSVNHYGLLIDRFCLTGGKSPIGYLKAYLTNLYLSADSEKVQEAIQEGIASATMFDGAKDMAYCDTQLRVAFDGDAVLFSDESDHIATKHGLDKFFQHESLFENKPLAQGPLKGFLEDLGRLQKKFYAKNERLLCPIRTYLVTARSAASSGARVLKTLRRWGLEIDEALFLAGAPKGPILVKIRPHIFFDDHMFHIEGAQKLGTVTAHVPFGYGQKFNT